MIEEPYRWVEAIANRREYIEHQLAPGSPIVALTYRDGILLFTLGRERQKIFEIYDRIALGAIGHPGDIERLRMAAIEIASTEGFSRSPQDVSLRRLANYSLSPVLKAAFEQIYGPPYLARLLFVELGRRDEPDLFVRCEYDGSLHTNGGMLGRAVEQFGVIGGSAGATVAMEKRLAGRETAGLSLAAALELARDVWIAGSLAADPGAEGKEPTDEEIEKKRRESLSGRMIEAAVLDRSAHATGATYRPLGETELKHLTG